MMDVVDEGKSMDESCYYSVLEIRKYASYSEIRLRIASLPDSICVSQAGQTRYTCVLLSRGSVLYIVLNLGSLTLFLLEICPDLCISNHTCLNDICIEKVGMELKEAKKWRCFSHLNYNGGGETET
ncbi:hypothetical protein L2E82_30259 [Cichorium intybus]|uniref:Uncharacterized protein n=1 Tax=Cichorium intybus TaxID=13427 RepID=A0ACB9CZX0_CICIN|nr:hypothetical protein L2E82_30259 [Cichorium intybus]